jgi:hypothetical protein
VQCFAWEAASQSAFAARAADQSTSVINIGYGLGFAHRSFEAVKGLSVELIEINPSVFARAKRESCDTSTLFHLGSWQDWLPRLAAPHKTIYFDAFPVERDFDYSQQSFIRYISPFLTAVGSLPWQGCYFVAFDSDPIPFPTPRNLRLERVAATPLQADFTSPGLTAISLYQLTRLSVNDTQGRA